MKYFCDLNHGYHLSAELIGSTLAFGPGDCGSNPVGKNIFPILCLVAILLLPLTVEQTLSTIETRRGGGACRLNQLLEFIKVVRITSKIQRQKNDLPSRVQSSIYLFKKTDICLGLLQILI